MAHLKAFLFGKIEVEKGERIETCLGNCQASMMEFYRRNS